MCTTAVYHSFFIHSSVNGHLGFGLVFYRYLFVLFLAVLNLCFCCAGFLLLTQVGATLRCGVVASFVAEHRL